MKRFSSLIFKLATGVVVLWLLGQFVSDRWLWSQWLFWIPTFAILVFLLCTTIVLVFLKDKRNSIVLGFVFILFVGWFLFVENRVFSTTTKHGDLRILGWTMSHSKSRLTADSAALIVELNADISLLTHGWKVRGEPVIKEWQGKKGKRLVNGPFTLFTTLRPLEVRTLVASNGIYISLYKLDTTEQIGHELVIFAVDLPADWRLSRREIVRRAKKLLRQADAPEPDLVIGDFNMTKNSNSLHRFFPNMKDGWDKAGAGWSYTYHRAFPLFQIDHMLLNKDLHPAMYELIDPQIGRHNIQLLELDSEDLVNDI
ncbi:MAG: hypothetical protein HOC93_06180 [Phycisphaerae bacterium]|jgi:hypothetical protein|nr:hypothetical protein [Phycisphaerae bacterium]